MEHSSSSPRIVLHTCTNPLHGIVNYNKMAKSSDVIGLNHNSLPDLSFILQANNTSEDIESLFGAELNRMTITASSDEILICLNRVNMILAVLDIQFRAYLVRQLRMHLANLGEMNSQWSLIVSEKVMVAIRSYIIFNYISALPEGLLHDILGWLSIDNIQSILYVSKEWYQVARNETHWKIFYEIKFPIRNRIEQAITSYYAAYRYRLLNPFIGDCVELAWRGKFRLEGLDVYRGLAWWHGKVVDRHVAQGKYKVHYDGWEDKWDEWITRSRVRWPLNPKKSCDGASKIIKRDEIIEVWCQGNVVPGAWLEARVKRIRGSRLQLDKVQMNELPLWVNQDQVRVLKCSFDQDGDDRSVDEVLENEQLFPEFDTIHDDAMNCGIL